MNKDTNIKFKDLPLYKKLDWTNTIFLISTPIIVLTWVPLDMAFNGLNGKVLSFFILYSILTSLSITAGYHRYFSHKSYKAKPWVEFLYLFFGSAAFQSSVLKWASAHRVHHSHVDTERDPYSITRGFFYAHMGWVFFKENYDQPIHFAPDLKKNKLVMLQHKYYGPLALFTGFGIPFLVGLALGSPWASLLYAGFVRAVFTQHCTFFINSLCHFWGAKPYSKLSTARDNFILAFLTYGEGYHNFHHRFQADYRNGIKWYHWDPTKWWIKILAFTGQAEQLRKVSPVEILRAKLQEQERQLLQKGIAADYVAPLRLRVEEAQKRILQLKSEYQLMKKSFREKRELLTIKTELKVAKLQLRMAKLQWIGFYKLEAQKN